MPRILPEGYDNRLRGARRRRRRAHADPAAGGSLLSARLAALAGSRGAFQPGAALAAYTRIRGRRVFR
ncbi:hypothetical protein [Nonomuraea sp. SYSU D8015]|uniref:hypothetical protein n=1 Tax=Nonomuraea sp. SYSU D8015 TaxID=2593644 RepID=UPI0016602A27|nr:hypothetical protein [Nonomuraea sp. SYSU D8015]